LAAVGHEDLGGAGHDERASLLPDYAIYLTYMAPRAQCVSVPKLLSVFSGSC
jgi:hypothetical protein